MSKIEQEICRKCQVLLVEGENWVKSFAKKHDRICKFCFGSYQKSYYQKNKKDILERVRKSIVSRHTKSLGSLFCPKCGVLGQLKRRSVVYASGNIFYFLQVDHCKRPSAHSSGYDRSCYIGVCGRTTSKISKNIISLLKQRNLKVIIE